MITFDESELTLSELKQLWPQTDDGRLCARLIKRYVTTMLIQSSLNVSATEETAQAECGAGKAIAQMIKHVAQLAVPNAEPAVPAMAGLHRFREETKPQTGPKP